MGVLRLQAVSGEFGKMNVFLEKEASAAGLDREAVNAVLLAAEEVFVNIASYAYPGRVGEVEISCHYDPGPGTFSMRFSDSGREFNPLLAATPDIDAPLEKRRMGGLGIFLTKKVMDSIEYQRVDGCNLLTMTKAARGKAQQGAGGWVV